jgi:hypothetical protein
MALIAMLADPILGPELMWADPNNHDFSGCYRVRDHQYPMFWGTPDWSTYKQRNNEGYACARAVGKTESIKARSWTHPLPAREAQPARHRPGVDPPTAVDRCDRGPGARHPHDPRSARHARRPDGLHSPALRRGLPRRHEDRRAHPAPDRHGRQGPAPAGPHHGRGPGLPGARLDGDPRDGDARDARRRRRSRLPLHLLRRPLGRARHRLLRAHLNADVWTIHTITKLQTPDWEAQEKEEAKAAYGSTSIPDYRRNIMGEAGAAASAFFVAARLMACVDQNRDSPYNRSSTSSRCSARRSWTTTASRSARCSICPMGLKACGAGWTSA